VALALYRTYRPASLNEVVGQEHVTTALRRALSSGRIHHAFLFSGPRGCGKTSTARIMARSLNCVEGPTPDPCGVCPSCVDLAPNGPGSIDVIELDAASHGGVDDTRDLRERAVFAPASSRYKIYIIDEAHMVTTAGFNALLKLVEEPPEHVRFIFATTEADKVLPTIRSRTHHYTFRLVPTKVLQSHLATISDSEGISYEPAALALIARAGAGSVRDSLSVLGQVVAGSGPEGVTYIEAASQLGVTDTVLLDRTVEALAAGDGAELFAVVASVVDAGHDPRRFASDLLERLRDLVVIAAVPDAAQSGLIDAPDDVLETMQRQAASMGTAELTRAADLVSEGITQLRGATAPRLQLELLCAKLLLPAADDASEGVAARLDRIERRVASLGVHALTGDAEPASAAAVSAPPPAAAPPQRPRPATPATPPAAAAAPPVGAPPRKLSEVKQAAAEQPVAAPVVASTPNGSIEFAEVQSLWPAVLESIKSTSRVAWMIFNEASPLSVDDTTLVIGVQNAGVIAGVSNGGHDERLRQAVLDVLRVDRRIEVILDPGAAPAKKVAPKAVAPEKPTRKRAAATETPAEPKAPDEASPDDPDLDGDSLSGEALAMRELGGTVIGEIGS
jgi:DNA polymerase-3 subunit gamma/tau